MRETELFYDIFFRYSVRPFEVVEVKEYSRLNFEILTSKFFLVDSEKTALTLKNVR